MISEYVNDLGLVFDIIGATLLFFFGLPADIDREGRTIMTSGERDEEEIKKGKRYDCWGRIGLGLLVIGFTLQLASNHLFC